ncbi:MAG TPA: HEAT repeat domain-containing protein, partial [Acidobacteriota bacterium]|nr:HEAT repeat domain-containing protein [Acidobacteriota bacterium]
MRATRSSMFKKAAGTGIVLLLSTLLFAQAGRTAPQAPAADSLDTILKDLTAYKFDTGVGPLLRLRAYVFAHKDDPAQRKDCEAKLIAFLQASPAPGGTMAACRALRLMGSAAAVPVLESMLLSADRTDPARYALEKIPGPEADGALLTALGKSQGDIKRGIIFSIGERRIGGAVPALEKLATGGDAAAAGDAVKALGKIGTAEAARVLTSVLERSAGQQKSGAASALLLCAESRLRENKSGEAAGLYEKLLKAGLPDVLRQAAFRGRVIAAGGDARGFILNALAGKDAVLYEPAIGLIPQSFSGMNVREVFGALPNLPEDRQVQLVSALGRFPGNAVRDTLVAAAGSALPRVRIEALRALERAANGTVVPLLAERSAGSTGDEQAAARETLARVRGLDVDDKIVEMLSGPAETKVKAELVQAAAERRIGAAKPVLVELARNSDPTVRLRAIRALSGIAAPADLRELLSLLFAIDDEAAREQMQDTVAAVARTIARPLSRGNAAEALFPGEKDPK